MFDKMMRGRRDECRGSEAREDDGHGRGRRFARPEDEFGGGRGGWGGRGGRHEGPGRGGPGRGGPGGRGGLGRFFAHGDLRLVILALVAEKPRHGYEMIKEIEERAGGAYSPSPGVIYPTLTLLEEMGHVTVTLEEGGKKLHTITPDGLAFLEANRGALEPVLARMEEARGARGAGPAPQVVRGMENLKLALRMRLSRGALTEAEAQAVAAALDAAATAVERA